MSGTRGAARGIRSVVAPIHPKAMPTISTMRYIDDARAADDKEALRILDLHAN
jgi:hypothetical protein